MKIKTLLLIVFFPIAVVAQENCVDYLEKAIKKMESDAAVQITFGYSLYDNSGVEKFSDDGSLKLNGDCYSLLLSPMKIWCDGSVQWSYMSQTNEIYITEAGSEESQLYNPIYFMGLYKEGYECEIVNEDTRKLVILSSIGTEELYDRVIIEFDNASMRPLAMQVFMKEEGYIKIVIDSYKPKCNFDKRVYKCPTEDFPSAEIVDMR